MAVPQRSPLRERRGSAIPGSSADCRTCRRRSRSTATIMWTSKPMRPTRPSPSCRRPSPAFERHSIDVRGFRCPYSERLRCLMDVLPEGTVPVWEQPCLPVGRRPGAGRAQGGVGHRDHRRALSSPRSRRFRERSLDTGRRSSRSRSASRTTCSCTTAGAWARTAWPRSGADGSTGPIGVGSSSTSCFIPNWPISVAARWPRCSGKRRDSGRRCGSAGYGTSAIGGGERSGFRSLVTETSAGPRVSFSCSPRATMLVRGIGPVRTAEAWDGSWLRWRGDALEVADSRRGRSSASPPSFPRP